MEGRAGTGNLADGFSLSARNYPDHHALEIGDQTFTYRDLSRRAGAIAALVDLRSDAPFVCLLANRSITAYAGVLGILTTGRGYVPLNPIFPKARNSKILELCRSDLVIVGEECFDELADLLAERDGSLSVVLPEGKAQDWRERFPGHRFFELSNRDGQELEPVPVASSRTAYLLFTSGSTGEPKGVPVSHGNALAYLSHVADVYQTGPKDRFSQYFELTFDLSVHDLFLCWQRGSCLCVLSRKDLLAPVRFIRRKALTVWFSVPSAGVMSARMRMLRSGAMPSLRHSLFCGEALPLSVAQRWLEATPNASLDNLYGPTEATIAITRFRMTRDQPVDSPDNGIVSIGLPFPGHAVRICDPADLALTPARGELLLSGPQVVAGYFENQEKTEEKFVHHDGRTWYRTGDLVTRDDAGILQFLGRIDFQVQILGHRVELQEVERVLREAAETGDVVVLPWPMDQETGRAEGLVGFVCGSSHTEEKIQSHCRSWLPEYMMPKTVHHLERMPLNASGKVDRKVLSERLANGFDAD